MPRYYFDLVDRDGEHLDEDGVECGDLDEAIVLARRTISEIALDLFRDTEQTELAIRIRDEMEGPVVLKVTLDTFSEP
jgi:hypothetical protein